LGGGEAEGGKHSVILRNVTAGSLELDSITEQFLSLEAEGLTSIDEVTARSSAYIEDRTEDGLGLKTVRLDGVEDSLFQLARQYQVPMDRLIQDNQLPDPSQLVVGQTILIQRPEVTHTVRAGDSLYSIAQTHHTTVTQLLRNNPALQGRDLVFPG